MLSIIDEPAPAEPQNRQRSEPSTIEGPRTYQTPCARVDPDMRSIIDEPAGRSAHGNRQHSGTSPCVSIDFRVCPTLPCVPVVPDMWSMIDEPAEPHPKTVSVRNRQPTRTPNLSGPRTGRSRHALDYRRACWQGHTRKPSAPGIVRRQHPGTVNVFVPCLRSLV
ncbi:hypothetical protein T484DRAFT_1751772 [Baffinella frigidus]|nr:hypothetical protein T484DRAFT_1751772 [Cryptophyta sp. CCMP2293]